MEAADGFCIAAFIFAVTVLLLQPLDPMRAFLAGNLIYLSPALIGERDYFYGSGPANYEGVLFVSLIVAATAFVCIILPPQRQIATLQSSRLIRLTGCFLALACIVLLVYFSLKYSPLFWVAGRKDIPLSGGEVAIHRMMASYVAIFGICRRHNLSLIVGSIALVIHTIMGDRTAVTMVIGAAFLHYGMSTGFPLWKIIAKKWVLCLLLAAVVLFGKLFYNTAFLVLRGDFTQASEVARITLENPSYPENLVIYSIFDKSIAENFRLDSIDFIGNLFRVVPLREALSSAENRDFNMLSQDRLFPAVTRATMARNPWAEAWAYGGGAGIAVVLMSFLSTLHILQQMAKHRQHWAYPAIILASGYFALYCHRNTLSLSIGTVVRTVLGFALLILCLHVFLLTIGYVVSILRTRFVPQPIEQRLDQ